MDKLARFMMRNRWWVILSWIAFVLLTNGISRGLGGANYKDEFKLPHTETQTVSDLLSHAGQNNQNGIDGILVLHAKTGDLKTAPASVITALEGQCVKIGTVVQIASPWGSIDCATGGQLDAAGANPKMLSTKDPIDRAGRRHASPATASSSRPTSPRSTTRLKTAQQLDPAGRVHRRRVPAGRAAEGHPTGAARLHRRADHPGDRLPHRSAPSPCRWSARSARSTRASA